MNCKHPQHPHLRLPSGEPMNDDDVKAAVERFHTWEFDGLDARDHATLLAHLDGEPARMRAACLAAVMEWRAGAADRNELQADCERRIAAAIAAAVAKEREAVTLVSDGAVKWGRDDGREVLWCDVPARILMAVAAAREEQRAQDIARSRKAKYALTAGKDSLAGAWNAGIESAIEGVESTPLTATPLADALARAEEGVRYWTDLAQAEARDAAALRARVAELEKTLKERDEQSLFEGQREHEWNASFNATAIERAEKAEAERDTLRAQVEAARAECGRFIDGMYEAGTRYTATDVLRAMDEAKP